MSKDDEHSLFGGEHETVETSEEVTIFSADNGPTYREKVEGASFEQPETLVELTLGETLRLAREQAGLTRETLAGLGESTPSTLLRNELGQVGPRANIVQIYELGLRLSREDPRSIAFRTKLKAAMADGKRKRS